eukprot:563722-Pyramimonas_sp.AAC.1
MARAASCEDAGGVVAPGDFAKKFAKRRLMKKTRDPTAKGGDGDKGGTGEGGKGKVGKGMGGKGKTSKGKGAKAKEWPRARPSGQRARPSGPRARGSRTRDTTRNVRARTTLANKKKKHA